MVADLLERSACNAESTGSSLVRNNYCVHCPPKVYACDCVGTVTKFFAYNSLQYYCIYATEAFKCTSELKYQSLVYCIVYGSPLCFDYLLNYQFQKDVDMGFRYGILWLVTHSSTNWGAAA